MGFLSLVKELMNPPVKMPIPMKPSEEPPQLYVDPITFQIKQGPPGPNATALQHHQAASAAMFHAPYVTIGSGGGLNSALGMAGSGGAYSSSSHAVMGGAGGAGGYSMGINTFAPEISIPEFDPIPDHIEEDHKLGDVLNQLLLRDQGIPSAEEVFENKDPFELVQFFNKIRCNYYIVLYGKAGSTVMSSFEYPMEGVMRVCCDTQNKPYLCIYHKNLDDLFAEQEKENVRN